MRSTLGFPTRGNKSSSTCISTHSLWFIYFRNLLLSPTNNVNTACLSQRFFSTRSTLQTTTHEQRVFQLWLLSGLEHQTSNLFRPSFSHRHFRSRAKPLYATHSSVATKVISNNNSNNSNNDNHDNNNIDPVTIPQFDHHHHHHHHQQQHSLSLIHQSDLIHPRWISKIKDRDIDLFLLQLKNNQSHLDDKFIFKLLRSRLYNANQYKCDEAWKIYLTMKDLNVIDYMRSNHYGHLLNIIKYSPDATSQLLTILNQMKSAKNAGLITISDLHYSQVFYGLARQGSVVEMCDLFDELKMDSLSTSISDKNVDNKKKLLPASFYTSLAVAAKKKDDIHATTRAADIIEDAMKSGVLMEMETCAIMISALSTNMESTVNFLTVMDQIGMMTKYTNINNNNNNNTNTYNVNDTQHHNNNLNINNTINHNHITTTNNNNNNNINNNNKMNNLNVHIYTSLISGLAHNGDAINARRLWKEMRNHGLRPTTATYTAMVEAFGRSGNLKAAIQMLKKYTYEHNGNLNKVMATSVLSNTIRHGRLDLAKSLVKKWTDEMGLRIENMDDEFKTAVMWVKVIDDVNQGLSFFNTLYKTNQNYVNSIMVNHLVKEYGELKDKTAVTESYSLHELVNNNANKIPASKSVDPDFYLVDALFKCRDVPAALSTFVKMRQRGLPDDITLAMVIRGLVMNDEGVAAWKLFRIIKIYGIEPNLHAYTSILKSCVPKSGNNSAQHQQSLKDEMSPELLSHIFNISNSIHHHPSMEIENKLSPTQAYILFRKMTGVQKPNVYTYTALISCFAKSNIGRAVDIFKYMCHDGIEPTIETYVSLLQGCAIFRNGRMALMVYQHLRENQHHLQPNDKVWHYLLKALVRSRVDKNEIDKLASVIRGDDGHKKKKKKNKRKKNKE